MLRVVPVLRSTEIYPVFLWFVLSGDIERESLGVPEGDSFGKQSTANGSGREISAEIMKPLGRLKAGVPNASAKDTPLCLACCSLACH